MIEKTAEIKLTEHHTPRTLNRERFARWLGFENNCGLIAKTLLFLADTLLLDGHSRCCVDREDFSMSTRRYWLK